MFIIKIINIIDTVNVIYRPQPKRNIYYINIIYITNHACIMA
jgi:hypothetical protein